jgi:uncharacterized protein YbjT (DUF2867 family)
MKNILVIGGTGRIARPVVRELIQAGYSVRVMTRNPQKMRDLLPPQVDWYTGDLQDKSALRGAMRGMDAVYINLPEIADPNADFIPEIHGTQAILETAPPNMLILKLSQMDAKETPNYHNLTFKFRAEAMIRASGLPYIIFQPTWFMDSLPLILTHGKSVMLVGEQPSPLYWIAGEDLGRQVVSAIRQHDAVKNRTFTIQGLEPLTFSQVGKRYADAMGLRVTTLPLWGMRLAGVFSQQYKSDYQLMAYYNRHVETFTSHDTWDCLGKPTITLDRFIENWQIGYPNMSDR